MDYIRDFLARCQPLYRKVDGRYFAVLIARPVTPGIGVCLDSIEGFPDKGTRAISPETLPESLLGGFAFDGNAS